MINPTNITSESPILIYKYSYFIASKKENSKNIHFLIFNVSTSTASTWDLAYHKNFRLDRMTYYFFYWSLKKLIRM